jgi:cob(I)alamin adenosyltransferase
VQFLKDEPTGELASLAALGIPVIRTQQSFGFTFSMDEEQRARCASEQASLLASARQTLSHVPAVPLDARVADAPALIILDEVLDALELGFLEEKALRAFLGAAPQGSDLILTGRRAPTWLIKQADYHTELKKLKHPFDQTHLARKSIES